MINPKGFTSQNVYTDILFTANLLNHEKANRRKAYREYRKNITVSELCDKYTETACDMCGQWTLTSATQNGTCGFCLSEIYNTHDHELFCEMNVVGWVPSQYELGYPECTCGVYGE